MTRLSSLPLVMLLAVTALHAQKTVTADSTNGIVLTMRRSPAPNCPLGMHASHGKGLPVGINAAPDITDPRDHAAPAMVQTIHLTMTNPLSRRIVGAEVVIHGYSARWRAMNLATSSQEPDLAKNVYVVLNMRGKGEVSRDLSLRRFAAITSVDLTSITYADGNAWHAPYSEACSVSPDMVMLVASSQ